MDNFIAHILMVDDDEGIRSLVKKYLNENVVHFGIMGKFEKRKHTEKIIKLWLSKYGNDNNYQLSVCCTNPFFKEELTFENRAYFYKKN